MAKTRYLKHPDGTLYAYTDALAKLPGFVAVDEADTKRDDDMHEPVKPDVKSARTTKV